jgi:hypothetical protein
MDDVLKIERTQKDAAVCLPRFLQREETAAQIVALMQAKYTRPGLQEMLTILRCAEHQITARIL